MSLEAVQKVAQSEQLVQREKAEAAETAKRLQSEAEKAGRERLAAARSEAEAQVKTLISQAEERAQAHTEVVLEETRRACDELRRTAEDRLEDAAALIIGKVVGV